MIRHTLQNRFAETNLLPDEQIKILDNEDDLPVDAEFLGKTAVKSLELALWHNGNGREPLLGNTRVKVSDGSSWRVYASWDKKTRYLLSSS